jgi:hypothetical protein
MQHVKRADELRPPLLQVVSDWRDDGNGALTRTTTAVEVEDNQEKTKMNAEPLTSRAATEAPPRPKKSKSNSKGAGPSSHAADERSVVIGIRFSRTQLAAIDTWRARFAGLDVAAAIRCLADLGLTARPREAVDPLAVSNATHCRIPRVKKGKPK